MRMRSRIGAMLVTVALAVPALPGSSDVADARPAVPQGFEGIRPTSELSAALPEVRGALSGVDGEEHVDVLMYAIPESPPNPEVGAELPSEVPVAIGAAHGDTFRVVADPSIDLTRFLTESGVVDLRAIAVSSDRWGMWVFSRRLDVQGRIIEPGDAGPATEVSADGTLTTVSDPDAITIDVKHPFGEAGGGVDASAQSSGCSYSYNYRPKTMIGAGFHRVWGARQTLTYWRQSTSTLGWGVNVDGNGWEVGGKTEKRNTDAYGVKWQTKGRQDRFHDTWYQYQLKQCGWIWNNGWGYWRIQELRPHHLAGGNPSRRATWYPVTPRSNCVRHSPGGPGPEMRIVRSTASTFSRGVRTPLIDLSSRSGFNTKTSIVADFARRIYVCGWASTPGNSPGLVVYGRPRR